MEDLSWCMVGLLSSSLEARIYVPINSWIEQFAFE